MNYGKMVDMSKKKRALLASVVGLGMVMGVVRCSLKRYEEKQKKEALEQVRAFFMEYGEIATIFINEMESTKDCLAGGVVMTDERVYYFENTNGIIWYEEECI